VANDPKVDRVIKLLRLAAPSSGATAPERESAALEAAKVFAENNLIVISREQLDELNKVARAKPAQKRKPVPQPRTPQRPTYGKPGWSRGVAAIDGVCADPDCGGKVERGEPVWCRINGFNVEYLHIDGACLW
jgi:hypothetical protein